MMWVTQILSYWSRQVFAPGTLLRKKYQYFRDLLVQDRHCLELMADIEEIQYRRRPCDYARVEALCHQLEKSVGTLIKSLIALNPLQYRVLKDRHEAIRRQLQVALAVDQDTSPKSSLVSESLYTVDLDQVPGMKLTGGKAHNLALMRQNGFATPPGFCITTQAFNDLIAVNKLRPRLRELLSRICLDQAAELDASSQRLQELILNAPLPETLIAAVERQLTALKSSNLAFRSSAFGEDSALTFAGQYQSLLNVDRHHWQDAYRQVLASKYTPSAMAYRIRAGLPDEHLPMAVLVLEMVDAQESGLVYSSEVNDPSQMGIYVVAGLADQLVGGEMRAREYRVPKDGPPGVDSDQPAYFNELVATANRLETFFEGPQDIEWAVGANGRLMLLQSRPLKTAALADKHQELDLPVLAQGRWASSGLGCGSVFRLPSRQQIHEIPTGSVVVTRGLYPELTGCLERMKGVIAEDGSAASHFATIAREHGLPVIIQVDEALSRFSTGQPVTLDGQRAQVHEGLASLQHRPSLVADNWFTTRMKALLPHIATLNLKDAESESFQPANCHSLHDLIRYTHEMGVREMFALADRKGRGLQQSKVLKLDIPLVFRVLNLENGLTEAGDQMDPVTLEQITCQPFNVLFEGLSHPAVIWDHNIQHFDWEQFDKLAGGVFNPLNSPLVSSYGLLAEDYMHVLIRFGYHFAVVDALLSPTPEHNYIQFSFKGGGANEDRRLMRLEVIRRVLARFDFGMELRGDLLKADYTRENVARTEARLRVIGYIMGKTRLLDMALNEALIDQMVNEFTGDLDAFLAL